MRIAITTFLLPGELDAYERMLFKFLEASQHIDGNSYELLTVMNLSDYFIDWENSGISKEYFIERFNFLKELTDWTPNVRFEIRDDIKGCTDLRRKALEMCPKATHFLWLDSDIAFDDISLEVLEHSINAIEEKQISNYVITPEIIKMWDSSWDCIVNEKYLHHPSDSIGFYNAFKECGIKGDISLETVDTFKFAGGWFTCLSRKLLELIPLPESLGPYFMDDTYIMEAMKIYSSRYINSIFQFKMKNLLVAPNHRYYNRKYYNFLMKKRDRRQESKEVANNNFVLELINFQKNVYENN